VPADTPVTRPLLLTVAMVGLALAQLPPLVALASGVVAPIHALSVPVIVGVAFTLTVPVVFVQPFASVKVNVTAPAETPVTVFPLTVALAVLLLTHVPPVEGVKVSVAPTQSVEVVAGVGVIAGFAFTVTALVVFVHPVPVCVKVNVTIPAATPITTPAFDTVANAVLLLCHVPPVVGVNVIVLPAHIDDTGALTTGSAFTVTDDVVELQPVVLLVNVNVTDPAATPETVLPLTVAFDGSLLTHVPPVAGVNVIVLPIHTLEADVPTVGGVAVTTTALPVMSVEHPLLVLVANTV
jgi:hypothetical protein